MTSLPLACFSGTTVHRPLKLKNPFLVFCGSQLYSQEIPPTLTAVPTKRAAFWLIVPPGERDGSQGMPCPGYIKTTDGLKSPRGRGWVAMDHKGLLLCAHTAAGSNDFTRHKTGSEVVQEQARDVGVQFN